ncbi:ataxia telangiectasia mutated [Apiospora arundinis]|uniref:Uncharacterized protein n=1 Tax=Apiospora arundinis TaxID=335852 RepID=A0ABR2I1U1_9PEZI
MTLRVDTGVDAASFGDLGDDRPNKEEGSSPLPREFHRFLLLLPELRLHVWSLSIEPREIVASSPSAQRTSTGNSPLNSTLATRLDTISQNMATSNYTQIHYFPCQIRTNG